MKKLDKLFNEFCKQKGYCPAVVKSRIRLPKIVMIRYKFYSLAKTNGHSLRLIGEVVGNRSHCAVIHGIKTLNDLIDTNYHGIK